MSRDVSRRKRPRHPMPRHVREALRERGPMQACRARPAYPQDDSLGWIARAKRPETRARRLARMLEELEAGDRSMKMRGSPRTIRRPG